MGGMIVSPEQWEQMKKDCWWELYDANGQLYGVDGKECKPSRITVLDDDDDILLGEECYLLDNPEMLLR